MAGRLDRPVIALAVLEPLLVEAAETELGHGRLAADAQKDLETLVAETLPDRGARAPAAEIRTGESANELIARARELDACLIVAGTRGLGLARRLWFGSTTTRLLRATDRPVLAVPAAEPPTGHEATGDGPLRIERVVCGVDFGAASAAAARTAVDLGARLGVPVTLLHAVPRVTAPPSWDAVAARTAERGREATLAQLRDLAAALTPAPEPVIRTGDAADALVEASTAAGAALIVVGLAGGLAHRPGSTATRVLAAAHLPVLAVPA
jgi:nucleotide-binding universal stress UspA family protein